MKTPSLSLLAAGVVAMAGVHLAPQGVAHADQCASYCNQKHPGAQAWLRPGCIALCKAGGFFKKVGQGIAKGFQAVAGGIVKVFLDLKDLIVCVAQKGGMDVVKLFGAVIKDPGGFFKKTFSDGWKFLKDLVVNLVTKGGETLSQIVGAATGGKLDERQFHAFGDWVWDQFETLARKVGALGCLVRFARPLKKVLRGAFGWLAKTVLPLLGKLYRNVLEPKLAGWLAKAVDWAVKTLLGEQWKDRLKAVAAKVFAPDARAKEAAKGIGAFLKMIDSGKGNLDQAWSNVRAMIATAPDFGVRKIALAVREGIKLLVDVLIDKLGPKVVDLGLKAVSGGLTLITRVVNGLCGLIPEVGAAVCAVITGAVRLLYDFVGSTLLKTLIMKGVDLLLKPLVKKLIDMVAAQITKAVTGVVDKAVARNRVVGNWARVFQPVIGLVSKVLTKWAIPDAKDKSKFLFLVAQLGDQAVKLAKARRAPAVAPRPTPPPSAKPTPQPSAPAARPPPRPVAPTPRPVVRPAPRPVTAPVRKPATRPEVRPMLRPPTRPAVGPPSRPVDRRALIRGFNQLYRKVLRGRVRSLRALRPLSALAARSKGRVAVQRALASYRRGLQAAVRAVYAVRRRLRSALARLTPAAAGQVSAALGRPPVLPAPITASGAATRALGPAQAALRELAGAGTRYLEGLVAAATGATKPLAAAMATRFRAGIGAAAAGLAAAARAIK